MKTHENFNTFGIIWWRRYCWNVNLNHQTGNVSRSRKFLVVFQQWLKVLIFDVNFSFFFILKSYEDMMGCFHLFRCFNHPIVLSVLLDIPPNPNFWIWLVDVFTDYFVVTYWCILGVTWDTHHVNFFISIFVISPSWIMVTQSLSFVLRIKTNSFSILTMILEKSLKKHDLTWLTRNRIVRIARDV